MQTSDKRMELEQDKDMRVLVGCPTSYHKEYCLKEYAEAVKSLSYKNYDVLIVDNSKDNYYLERIKGTGLKVEKGPWFEGARDRIVESRNIIREKAIEEGYDYLLSLEQDVIPPKDIIEKLLRHRKKVITGIYFARNTFPNGITMLMPLAYKISERKEGELPSMRPLTEEELLSNRLIRVVSCGMGCVMIARDILKEIRFRYEKNTFDDRWFCIDLYKKGINIYADTSVKCKHMILNRPYGWRKIRK